MATVTFKNDIVCNLGGTEINVGDTAPVVTVVNCDPMLQDEQIGGEGKVQLVVAVPSLDTGVCDAASVLNLLVSASQTPVSSEGTATTSCTLPSPPICSS